MSRLRATVGTAIAACAALVLSVLAPVSVATASDQLAGDAVQLRPDGQRSDAPGGTGAAWFGDGFGVHHEGIGIRSGYVLRPVTSHTSHGDLVAPLTDLAAELSLVTGATFTVGAPVGAQTSTTGEITVELSTTSACGPLSSLVVGCGGWGESTGDDTIDFGNVWLSPTVLADDRLLRAAAGHEVGHALGLVHYDDAWDGEVQLLHTAMADLTLRHYRDGDVRGLRQVATDGFLDGADPPALPPLVPEDLVVAPVAGGIEVDWRVVDQGSELVGHEIEVADAGAPSGTVHATTSARRAVVEPLTPGSAVIARVRAANAVGWGPWSPWSDATTPAPLCLGPFPDVAASHPFCEDVAWLVGAGIATGYADGSFHPTTAVSRQAMAAFLRRFAESVDPGSTAGPWPGVGFVDVSAASPFREDIAWLASTGIAGGYADGGYHPAAPVSRQAMASLLRRVAVHLWGGDAGLVLPGAIAFIDVGLGHLFYDDIAWMRQEGLAEGTYEPSCDCATYLPTSAVSRQAMAAFLHDLAALAP